MGMTVRRQSFFRKDPPPGGVARGDPHGGRPRSPICYGTSPYSLPFWTVGVEDDAREDKTGESAPCICPAFVAEWRRLNSNRLR